MKKHKGIKNASIIVIFAMIIGYFLGAFFVWLSNQLDFLHFLNYLGFYYPIGIDNIIINLMFMVFEFSLNFNISILGSLLAIISIIIYLRR